MVGQRMLNLTDTRPMACRDRQFPAVMFKTITGKGPVMKDSVIRLKTYTKYCSIWASLKPLVITSYSIHYTKLYENSY